jgi:hypothetical protein
MKPGSKAYILLMRKIYWFTLAATVMGIPPLVIQIIGEGNEEMIRPVTRILTPGFIIIGIFQFFSAFEPIRQSPRWDIIFPELRNQNGKKKS